MKTKKLVLEENKDYKALVNAVVSRIGLESVSDVNNHGIDGGYGGFIYYSDTHAFAMRYRRFIIPMLEDDAAQMGYANAADFVASFNCLDMDSDDYKDLYRNLGGGRLEQCSVTNALAWYAAETVCRWFED